MPRPMPRSPSRPFCALRAGYTLIEMMTTVAVLIILLGLMVSLARHVRERAAVALTKDVLRQLDAVMARNAARDAPATPAVAAFPPLPTTTPADDAGQGIGGDGRGSIATVNAPPQPRGLAGAVAAASTGPSPRNVPHDAPPPPTRPGGLTRDPPASPDPLDRRAQLDAALANSRDFVLALRAELGIEGATLADMPLSMYDGVYLRDAWGSPIVFMPASHAWIGTAPRNASFFFSPGPDRAYLTLDDNLYSYEEVRAGGR